MHVQNQVNVAKPTHTKKQQQTQTKAFTPQPI